MAAVTQNLSFGVTVNLSYEHPYQFARRFASLDHLTQGRIGWNIVTGYLDSAERLIGQKGLKTTMPAMSKPKSFRTLLQILGRFWENDAVKKDKARRVLQIHLRCIPFTTMESITRVKVCFRYLLLCNALQPYFKQVLHLKVCSLQHVMLNVYLLGDKPEKFANK